MTLSLELAPDVAASLARQAAAHGLPLDAWLRNLIEDLARTRSAAPSDPRTALDALAELGRTLPHLPSAAFSRESIYQNHD